MADEPTDDELDEMLGLPPITDDPELDAARAREWSASQIFGSRLQARIEQAAQQHLEAVRRDHPDAVPLDFHMISELVQSRAHSTAEMLFEIRNGALYYSRAERRFLRKPDFE